MMPWSGDSSFVSNLVCEFAIYTSFSECNCQVKNLLVVIKTDDGTIERDLVLFMIEHSIESCV